MQYIIFAPFFLWLCTYWYTLHCLRNREYFIIFSTHIYIGSSRGGIRPYPLRFHVEEAGAHAKLIQHGPLGVAYHRRHPISDVPVARITAHATVPGIVIFVSCVTCLFNKLLQYHTIQMNWSCSPGFDVTPGVMCGRALRAFPLEKLSPPVGAQPGGAVSAAQRSPFVDPGLDGSSRHLILLFGSEGSAGLESSRVLWTIQTWSTTFWCDHIYTQEGTGYVSKNLLISRKNRGRLSVLSQPFRYTRKINF